MPTDYRLRLEDFQSIQHARSQTIQPSKHRAVNVAEDYSLRAFAPQHIELVSKNQNFGFQRGPRPDYSDQDTPDQLANILHQGEYQPIRGCQSAVLGLR